MWRLVVEHVATLSEVEDGWTLEDVLDANEALDVFGDANDPDRVPPDDDAAGGKLTIMVSVRGAKT